jgi:DNA-binding LacI/PurR family transcriptional regulator
VPHDVSVVAICPDEVAVHATPHLTSVRIPAEEVGSLAVELLMSRLRGTEVPATTLLAPAITDRGSTAPCGTGGPSVNLFGRKTN